MKNFWKGIDYTLVAFITYVINLIVDRPSFEQGLVLFVISITYIASRYFKSKEAFLMENQNLLKIQEHMHKLESDINNIKIDKMTNVNNLRRR